MNPAELRRMVALLAAATFLGPGDTGHRGFEDLIGLADRLDAEYLQDSTE